MPYFPGFPATLLQTWTHCTRTVQPLFWGCNTKRGLGHPFLERTQIFFSFFLSFFLIKGISSSFSPFPYVHLGYISGRAEAPKLYFVFGFFCRVFPSHVSQHPRKIEFIPGGAPRLPLRERAPAITIFIMARCCQVRDITPLLAPNGELHKRQIPS